MKSTLLSGLAIFAAGLALGAAAHRHFSTSPAAMPTPAGTPGPAPAPAERVETVPSFQPATAAPEADLSWEGNPVPAADTPIPRPPPEFTRSWPSNDGPPWARGDWTNREAWMARRAEEMKERAAEQRSNFVAEAKLDEDQATRFDVLVAAMNMRLEGKIREWSALMQDGTLPRPETRARAMKEISEIMVMTYDELDRNMPEGWRDSAGTNFNLNTFVDPELWRDMRPLLRGGFRGGPPPGGGTPPVPGR